MYSTFKDGTVSPGQTKAGLNRWSGRVALVTGASAGIGKAIVVELLNQGLQVVGCSRRLPTLENTPSAYLPIECDVSKEEDIQAMFEKIKGTPGFGGVDICINNAGSGDFDKFEDGKTSTWERMLMVNILGLSICTREAIKSMRERGVDDGHVIHIGSLVGHKVIHQVGTIYCATKFAVTALTEALRQELAALKSKIRVTQLAPGFVASDFIVATGNENMAKYVVENFPCLRAEDLAAEVINVLAAPEHVQVHDVTLTANYTP